MKPKSAKRIIIGNWKMNPLTIEEAKVIFSGVKRAVAAVSKVEVVIAAPAIYLAALKKLSEGSKVMLGAQDTFEKPSGSFTGFLSAEMLQNAGAEYVIIGHSERRARGETDEMVNRKLIAALEAGLKVILCIGESERSKSGVFLEFIKNQLHASLHGADKSTLKNLIIAYEPVWAIGASEAMNPRDLHQMTIFIRKVLTSLFPQVPNLRVPILYGGSVDAANCEAILFEGEAQGLLVGRASLDPKAFGEIIMIANSRSK